MKVSIIIPTYNEQKDILNCLKSLYKQTYKNLEIIVVDDGSTDQTVEMIQKEKVKLLKQSHLGTAQARNFGAANAKGEILVFVDADMTFDHKFIEKLIDPIEKLNVAGTFSRQEKVQNPDNVWSICWNINRNLPKDRMLPENYPDTQKVFRAILKSEFDKVGGFDSTGYNDDWTLSEKLHFSALDAPGAIFYHRNPDNLREVWTHATWVAKRRYKSVLLALIRFSLPFSLIIGLYKALNSAQPFFLVFKIIYDLSAFISLIKLQFNKNYY